MKLKLKLKHLALNATLWTLLGTAALARQMPLQEDYLEAQQHQVIDANVSGTNAPHVIASIRIVLVAIPRRIRSGGGEDDRIHLDEEINDFCDLSQHLSARDKHRRAL